MLPVVEVRWWDGWFFAFLIVVAMFRLVETDETPNVGASVIGELWFGYMKIIDSRIARFS
jgi:hypothetical protein